MNRPLLTLMATGLSLIPAFAHAQTLPLPLTGPAYVTANEAYSAYERKDYDLAIAKAREALRQRADIQRLNTLIVLAQRDKDLRDHPRRYPQSRQTPGFGAAAQAFKAYDRDDFGAAAQAARKAIAQAPKRMDYRLLLIESLQRQPHLQEADQATTQALAMFPDDDALLTRRAAIRRQLAVPLAVQGYRALQQGHVPLAVDQARKAVAWAPEIGANQQLLISALLAANDYPGAEQAASAALAQDDGEIAPWILRSYALDRQGKTQAAQTDLKQALAIDGLPQAQVRNIRFFAADAALAHGEPQQALDDLQPLVDDEGGEIARRRSAARVALRQKNNRDLNTAAHVPAPALNCQETAFGLVCDIWPGNQRDDGTDLAAQAYAALARKDFETAVAQANQAVGRAPHNPAYRRLLVGALTDQKHVPEAIAAASDGLKANGDDARLLSQRGFLRQQSGDDTGARQDFTQALALGSLPAYEEASLYAAIGQRRTARERLQQARDTGELEAMSDLQIAYLSVQAGDDDRARESFRKADAGSRLSPTATQDAAYNAMRVNDDEQAVTYFKRVIDAKNAGELDMSPQQLFDTRRAVADVSRTWGLISTTSYRGNSSSSGLSSAPSSGSNSNDSLQNSTELSWRPLGYRNARFVELYGRVTDTLWSKNSDSASGIDALQGAVGVRVKPFTALNVMAAVERTFPLGSSDVNGDWLVRLGYSSSIGTDLRVDTSSWWTSQLFAEGGHYINDSRDYFNSEWQVGRSYAIGGAGSHWVSFPHVVAAFDYDSKMNSETDTDGSTSSSSGKAAGIGVGNNVRYWFREDAYNAPRSYVDFSLQYRVKVLGDDRAQGVFARLTYSY
ncbi:Flp pilus assembly protein TadD [Pseudomonas sp. PvR086]|uniref:NfrA family protein n=1 Tax=Pseudomonas TaxID=286 RepID=UPI000B34AD62|nr:MULTISPECIES: tetratricopeptide repeat protein [Pseudomonas]MDR7106006.1 Flp pilus assembly protein TadD [Pseudomonas frederiksbergensis]PMY47292.1 bacteriophage N4 adsorption protein A [Pseudomonas sp. FW305-53]PMY84036.1 bacteriophage N4 adsorption protein A [Pseudomonas sp. FW303-C2]PMY90075.1 bacteriophage N4 adsorption protein A [Pseudomonas sp. FW305-62]PNA39086.1 bacteriophage N4 adsorption protein A [Pseudomonas sp. FW306-2-2C-A10BC]